MEPEAATWILGIRGGVIKRNALDALHALESHKHIRMINDAVINCALSKARRFSSVAVNGGKESPRF